MKALAIFIMLLAVIWFVTAWVYFIIYQGVFGGYGVEQTEFEHSIQTKVNHNCESVYFEIVSKEESTLEQEKQKAEWWIEEQKQVKKANIESSKTYFVDRKHNHKGCPRDGSLEHPFRNLKNFN